jgi:hypothetical protein
MFYALSRKVFEAWRNKQGPLVDPVPCIGDNRARVVAAAIRTCSAQGDENQELLEWIRHLSIYIPF